MADQFLGIDNTNISSCTKQMWVPNVVSQTLIKMPMFAKMYLTGAVKKEWDGGSVITRPIKTANMAGLAQSFGEEDKLTGGRVTMLGTPSFGWKDMQVPIVYTRREATMNRGPNAVFNFSKFLTESGYEAARIYLYLMMYNPLGAGGPADALGDYQTAAVAAQASTDGGKLFQSVIHALDHGENTGDIGYTYGNITRDLSGNTADYWQSGDVLSGFDGNGVTSNQDTEITLSIANFRKMLSVVRRKVEPANQFLCVVGPTLYQAFQSVIGSGVSITKGTGDAGDLVKFGFNSFTVDGIEVVEDPFLIANNASAQAFNATYYTGMEKWMFIYHIPSWELRFQPGEFFRLTDFQDQAVIIGGYPQSMARVYCTGNLMNWQPQSNIWLNNVVPAS